MTSFVSSPDLLLTWYLGVFKLQKKKSLCIFPLKGEESAKKSPQVLEPNASNTIGILLHRYS